MTAERQPEPTPEGGPWEVHKVPQVKPGDAVVSASSGRILQNKEGTITEVPNGLRVPWFPTAVSESTPTSFEKDQRRLEAFAEVINDIRATLFAYNMVE